MRDLLRLARPVMLSRAGILVMAFVDIAKLGRYGPGAPGVMGLGVAISGLIFVPDTLQVVLGQTVRALGDAWVPVDAYVASFLILMVPLGWWLAVPGGWDERGLILAIIASCTLATVLLGWRFHVLTRPTA